MSQDSILCIGGANIDWIGQYPGNSFPINNMPITFKSSFGGVMHNIAQNLKDLGHAVSFMSVVGADEEGEQIIAEINKSNFMDKIIITLPDHTTASIIFVINPQGKHLFMQPRTDIYDFLTPNLIKPHLSKLKEFSTWVVDTNLSEETLSFLASIKPVTTRLYAVIACPPKSKKIIPILPYLDAIFLNQIEASLIVGKEVKTDKQILAAAKMLYENGVKNVFITLGEHGACVYSHNVKQILPIVTVNSTDTTGAGDAFAAGVISGLLEQASAQDSLRQGLIAASLAVEIEGKTYGMLSKTSIEQRKINLEN